MNSGGASSQRAHEAMLRRWNQGCAVSARIQPRADVRETSAGAKSSDIRRSRRLVDLRDVEVCVVHEVGQRSSEAAEEPVLVNGGLHRRRDVGEAVKFANAARLQLQQRVRLDASSEPLGESGQEIEARLSRSHVRRERHDQGAGDAVTQALTAAHQCRQRGRVRLHRHNRDEDERCDSSLGHPR